MDTLQDAKAQYTKLSTTFDTVSISEASSELLTESDPHKVAFWEALYHDLNISEALAELFAIHKLIHKHNCGTEILKELGQAIGLFLSNTQSDIPDNIQQLAQQRWDAKKAKNYELADQLRHQIQESGYVLDDTAEGFRVRVK